MPDTAVISMEEVAALVDPMREERLQKLREYNAREHLKKWPAFNKQTGLTETVEYYPAAWRLYELSLKYPLANFSIEIVHMDPAKDLIVLKARLFFGEVYEKSSKRAEALKQGRLSNIDKVETAAKARAARDFGIGTEHALDMEDAAIEGAVVGSSLVADSQGATVNLATAQDKKNIEQLCKAVGRECPNLEGLKANEAMIIIQNLSIEARERAQAQQQEKREAKKESYLKKIVPSESPTESTQLSPEEAQKQHFLEVYDYCKSLNLFPYEDGKSDANLASFYKWVAPIVKVKQVTHWKQLTDSRLSAIQTYANNANVQQAS